MTQGLRRLLCDPALADRLRAAGPAGSGVHLGADGRRLAGRAAARRRAGLDSRPMRIIELAACPACGSRSLATFELGGGNRLRRCERCTTVSAPDYADPSEVYVDGYMFGEAGPFGLDVRAPEFQRYLMRVAHRRLAIIERATGVRGGSLLDLGSGTGEVLLAARARGWRGQGVEPEHTAAQMAADRGLEVVVATLEQSGLPQRSFDVVSAFHVLEHQPDSRAFLESMARWVRPGGFVVIEVPNWQSVQRRRLGERWTGLRPHEHLVHFTPSTLAGPSGRRGSSRWPRSPAYIGPPRASTRRCGTSPAPPGGCAGCWRRCRAPRARPFTPAGPRGRRCGSSRPPTTPPAREPSSSASAASTRPAEPRCWRQAPRRSSGGCPRAPSSSTWGVPPARSPSRLDPRSRALRRPRTAGLAG